MSRVEVAGPGTAAPEAKPSTAAQVTGPGTAAKVAGPRTAAQVTGPSTAAQVTGPGTATEMAGLRTAAREAGPSTAADVVGLARQAGHRVVVLALDGVVAFDLSIPSRVFTSASMAAGRPLYETLTCTLDGGPVRTTAGFSLLPDHGPEIIATADTLVVPGPYEGPLMASAELEPRLAAALATAPKDVRWVSICTGAFVLAAAGLLDGREATTHWFHADDLAALHPNVRVTPDVLFVDDGQVLTSAGAAAGIDLCLHIVRTDHGSEVANHAARRVVVPAWRDGGQRQFIERPVPEVADAGTSATRQWMVEHLDQPLDLRRLAAHARMSVRTFTRRFREETGLSPGQWLLRERVERARHLLESTELSVERIARDAGFGTTASLRQHLNAAVGVAPLAYRRSFTCRRPDRPA